MNDLQAGTGGRAVSNTPRRRQKRVLVLESKRPATTIGYSIGTVLAVAACASVLLYHTTVWPAKWRIHGGISPQATTIVAVIAGCLAALWLTFAIINGRRWHIARVVRRLSERADSEGVLPDTQMPWSAPRATQIPALNWDDRRPRKVPKPAGLRRVTATRNVVGRRPISIVYLRTFENQPRARTFVQGAWREFGYVYLLRSAASVTPAELRQFKRSRNLTGLLIRSAEQFDAELARPLPGPSRKRFHLVKNVGPQTISVRDRYGSYPPRTFLCHGSIWKSSVDALLRRADLVVLDMSGMMPANAGVHYELQRVIDLVRIEQVIFLADQRSDRDYLHNEIGHAWSQMASGSPNSGTRPGVARLTVTDSYQQIQQHNPQGQTTYISYRLIARRWQSRRLAAELDPDKARPLSAQPPQAWPWGPPGAGQNPPAPSVAADGRRVSIAARTAQLAILIGAVSFSISVAMLRHYLNSNGGESLLTATTDPASPVHPRDFKILIVLAGLALLITLISMIASRPRLTIGAAIASAGLIGYTVYIPSKGAFPGFGPYGSSYWISLAVAIAMALSALVAAIARPAMRS
jgi:hypothetical protein